MSLTYRSLNELLADAEPTGEQTVPDRLFGCWRRNWIRFGDDGAKDSSVQVRWLQTASGMGDLRIDPQQTQAESDSSCGITIVDQEAEPHMTAGWLDGPTGFAQQAVSNFPEKGWLVWDTPSVMRELAPSGAYVEEWERLPDSVGPVAHFIAPDAPTTTNLYVAGQQVFLAVRSPIAGGLHQFSCATQAVAADTLTVELSSSPTAVGKPLELNNTAWQLISYRHE